MFLILPVGMDYRARRYPVVTFTLMGICTAVYLVTFVCELFDASDATRDWIFGNLWLIPAESHWWTYVTSQFVHGGIFHLVGNMIYLFLFGACVEDMIGRMRFIFFYLLCGLAAALTFVLVSSHHFTSTIPMGGASGAISGCIGGYLLLRAKAKIDFKWIFFFWFRVWSGDFSLPAWLVISFWFLEDFALMTLSALAKHNGGGTAFAAHVGGTLVGIGLMAIAKMGLKSDDDEEEESAARPVVRMRAAHAVVAPASPAAMSEEPSILLFANGAQSGPFTQSQIEQMFLTNEIAAETFYWQEGMDDWRSAEELRAPGVP